MLAGIFLATIPGLEGKSINNIKGSCDIIKAYAWDAKNQEWKTLNLDEVAFYLGPLDPLWVGFVIKVSDNCKLETSTGDGTSPPGLPGDSQEESLSCTDSDGGLNYNVKGTTSGKSVGTGNMLTNQPDRCKDDKNLVELFCNNNLVDLVEVACPNGCKDGACVSTSTTTTTINRDYCEKNQYEK